MAEISWCGVIAGDVVGSSGVPDGFREALLGHLKDLFQIIGDAWPGLIFAPFEIYRGDGFQRALADPSVSARVVLIIRSGLRSGFSAGGVHITTGARIAIGMGSADFLIARTSADAGGERFLICLVRGTSLFIT